MEHVLWHPTLHHVVAEYLLLLIFYAGDSYVVHGSCDVGGIGAGLTDNRDLQKIPLYAHVADLAGTKQPFVLPVPFQNVINGGMLYPLKNLCPHFYYEY